MSRSDAGTDQDDVLVCWTCQQCRLLPTVVPESPSRTGDRCPRILGLGIAAQGPATTCLVQAPVAS